MALVTSFTLVRTLAILHITMGFYMITSPRLLADQNVVIILGEAMRIPRSYAFDKPTPVTAFLGILFIFLGMIDLTAVSMHELIALEYWSSQAPVRTLFFFLLTGYIYLFKPDSRSASSSTLKYYRQQNTGNGLQNGLVFSWGFLEVLVWFWAYTLVRAERRQRGARISSS